MARKSTNSALADQITAALNVPTEERPRTLGELAARCSVAVEDVQKELAKKKLKALVTALGNEPGSRVVRNEELEQAVASDEFLRNLVASRVTPDEPAVLVGELKKSVPKACQPAWMASLETRVQENRWPEGIAVLGDGKKRSLHWTAFPLPEVAAAQDLLKVLRSHRDHGGDYPAPLRKIAAIARPGDVPIAKAAIGLPDFQQAVVGILKVKDPLDGLVILAGDEQRAVAGETMTGTLLGHLRKTTQHGFTVGELKTTLTASVADLWERDVESRIDQQSLPPGVGFVRMPIKKSRGLLFRLGDIVSSRATAGRYDAIAPTSASPPTPATTEPATIADRSFAERFEAAFRSVESRSSEPNFVSLVDLRRELPMDRGEFDRELYALRRAGVYTMSAAEGRHGLSAEQREAGIFEDGTLQLFVSRRLS